MTLSLYSDESRMAEQLRRGRFRIYYDREDKLIHIESENETEKGYPLFNSVYNKKEVDDIIATGGHFDPTSFKRVILMQGLKMIDVQNSPNMNKVETYSEFATHTVENMLALNDKVFKPETFIKTKLIDDGKIVLYSNGEAADADTYERLFNILKQNFEEMVPDVKDVKERTTQISVNKDFVSNYDVITEIDGYLKTTKSVISNNIYPYNHHIFYGVYPPLPSTERNDITEKPVYGKIYQTADIEIFGKCEVDGELKAAVITDHEDRIKAAETSIKNDENTIRSQGERLATAETNIQSHETRINSAETKIQDHETRIEKLEEGGGGDSYWKINENSIVAAKTETITPVSELWINPNNLIWNMYSMDYIISDMFSWNDGTDKHDSVYVSFITAQHTTKEIRGFLDAISYKGLRINFKNRNGYELNWTLNDNNTMNVNVVKCKTLFDAFELVDEHVQVLPPFYNGNHRYGIGFIAAGRSTSTYTRDDLVRIVNDELKGHAGNWTVSIAGIDPGDDENEPFEDYTPEETTTTISSIYPVKNNFVMEGPNMLSLTQNYFDRLAITLDETVETKGTDYIRLTFTNITKDILANSTYTGTLMTYYLPPTKFVNAGGYGIEKICIYRIRTDTNEYQYKTDALILQNGVWTTSLLTIDEVEFCFDLSLADDYTPRNMYELGLSRIVLEIHNQILTTDKSIVCDEIIANNTFQYQPSTIPNFYAPKEIGEEVVNYNKTIRYDYDDYPNDARTLWYIDFGYEPNSEEFKQLGLGQEFRFIDEVAKYEFKAKVVEDENHNRYWQYENGTIPYYDIRLDPGWLDGMEQDSGEGEILLQVNARNNYMLYTNNIAGDDVQFLVDVNEYISNPTSEKVKHDLNTFYVMYMIDLFSNRKVAFKTSKSPGGNDITLDKDKYDDLTHFDMEIFDHSRIIDNYHNHGMVCVVDTSYEDRWRSQLGNTIASEGYTWSDRCHIWIEFDDGNRFYMEFWNAYGTYEPIVTGIMKHVNASSFKAYQPVLTFSKDSQNKVMKKVIFEKNQGLKFYIDPQFLDQVSEEIKEQWDMQSNIFTFMYKTGRFKIYPLPENTTALYTDKNIITDKIIVGRNIESFLYSLNEVGNQVVDALIDISNLTTAVRELDEKVNTLAESVKSLWVKVNSMGKTSIWGTVLGALGLAVGIGGILNDIGAFAKAGSIFKRLCCRRRVPFRRQDAEIEFEELEQMADDVGAFSDGENIEYVNTDLDPDDPDFPPTVLLPHTRLSDVLLTGLSEGNNEYIHVPWYMLNASDEIYELVRNLVGSEGDTYKDVESHRTVDRYFIGDSLPLFEYEYAGWDMKDQIYDTRSHFRHRCYIEVRSAIRNVFECGVTDFFNKFEQTPPRSAIIQTPENIEFRVDSITFDNKDIKGFADKNNESTWTSDKLVDADFVKDRFNKLETQLNLLIRSMSSIANRLNTLENRLNSL